MLLWIAMLTSAWADPSGARVVHSSTGTHPAAHYSFELPSCDGVRARVIDTHAANHPPIGDVFVILHNTGNKDCTYTALQVGGTLVGGFRPNRPFGDAGFIVPAHDQTELRLSPNTTTIRPLVTLEAAPGRGVIYLNAPPANEVPPELLKDAPGAAPSPTPEATHKNSPTPAQP